MRVILGRYGRASSPIRAPEGINYLHVRLKDGQRWRYAPPDRHTVAWLAVDEGGLRSHAPISTGELAVFEESGGAIELEADGDTSSVLGSAIKQFEFGRPDCARKQNSKRKSDRVLDVGPGEFPEQLGNTLNLGNDVTSKDTNTSSRWNSCVVCA